MKSYIINIIISSSSNSRSSSIASYIWKRIEKNNFNTCIIFNLEYFWI